MKKITKYLPLIIALCAIADTQFDLLISIGLSQDLVNYIKLLGLVLAIFLPSINEMFEEPISIEPAIKDPILKSNSVESDLYGKRPNDRRRRSETEEEGA